MTTGGRAIYEAPWHVLNSTGPGSIMLMLYSIRGQIPAVPGSPADWISAPVVFCRRMANSKVMTGSPYTEVDRFRVEQRGLIAIAVRSFEVVCSSTYLLVATTVGLFA